MATRTAEHLIAPLETTRDAIHAAMIAVEAGDYPSATEQLVQVVEEMRACLAAACLDAREEVSAADVALEFVATKVALMQLIEDAVGGQTVDIDGLEKWAYESPVALPQHETYPDRFDEAWMARLIARGRARPGDARRGRDVPPSSGEQASGARRSSCGVNELARSSVEQAFVRILSRRHPEVRWVVGPRRQRDTSAAGGDVVGRVAGRKDGGDA